MGPTGIAGHVVSDHDQRLSCACLIPDLFFNERNAPVGTLQTRPMVGKTKSCVKIVSVLVFVKNKKIGQASKRSPFLLKVEFHVVLLHLTSRKYLHLLHTMTSYKCVYVKGAGVSGAKR